MPIPKKLKKKAIEVADALGGEDEKAGIQAAKEFNEAISESHHAREEWETSKLKRKKDKKAYKNFLARMLRDRMETIYSSDWNFATSATRQGVAVAVISPDGRKFARGFKPAYDTKLDRNAIEVLVSQAENTILKESYVKGRNNQIQTN